MFQALQAPWPLSQLLNSAVGRKNAAMDNLSLPVSQSNLMYEKQVEGQI